jgi:hypothetical protein
MVDLTNYIKHRTPNLNALYASERALALLGKERTSHFAISVITTTCYANTEIQRLAGLYLAGSSERAERNLENLDTLLIKTFNI